MRELCEWALRHAVVEEKKTPLEELDDLERGMEVFRRYASGRFVELEIHTTSDCLLMHKLMYLIEPS